ncbi:hypothetical protein ACIBIZ_14800 [Nonomuraea spiralis]|uniref:hypothetical protein n=1 Tax=Nonomuraea spiralis TaxID=46182 RepID=UPI0037AA85AB
MMADPDPEFFSVGVTPVALLRVSMLVESHLEAEVAGVRSGGSPFWRAMGKGILDRLGSGVPAGRE